MAKVRGTPASGKSSLAYLLRKYIVDNYEDLNVCLLSRYREEPVKQPSLGYRQWLSNKGWEFRKGGVLILDEAQLSYWDEDLWDQGLKTIGSSTPYMVILFVSYGSASRNLSAVTSFRLQEEQLVGLARGRSPSVGLLLTEEEAEEIVKIKFPDHRFDKSLLNYVYDLTSGHVGAYCDALEVIKKHGVSLQSANWNLNDNDSSHTVKTGAANTLTTTLFSILRWRISFRDCTSMVHSVGDFRRGLTSPPTHVRRVYFKCSKDPSASW